MELMHLVEVQSFIGGPIIQQIHADVVSSSAQNQQSVQADFDNGPIPAQIEVSRAEQPEPLQNETLLQRVIKAKVKAWGSSHSTTIDSIIHLANLYTSQSRLTEARSLLLQAFRDWKSTQTKSTPEILNLLTLLAEVDCQLDVR